MNARLRRRAQNTVGVVAAVVAFTSLAAPASATAAVDQSQTQIDSSIHSHRMAQTFTAGATGQLTKVVLSLSRHPSFASPPDLVVEIRTVDNAGKPTTTVLAAASVAPAAMPSLNAFGWVDVEFNAPAVITSGTMYAIALYSPPFVTDYHWSSNATNPYAAGSTWRCHSDQQFQAIEPGCWFEESSRDLAFETYVDASGGGSGAADLRAFVASLTPADVRSPGQIAALDSRLDDIDAILIAGDTDAAIAALANLRRRGDGCGAARDANDWLVDCDDQVVFQGLVDEAIATLELL